MEERIVIQVRDGRAPWLTCTAAAQALGADLQRLEHVLDGGADEAPDARGQRTGSGLREDQAAAALSVLTDRRRVSVIDAPAAPSCPVRVRFSAGWGAGQGS
jgi:hypothetical protein